MPDFCGRCSNCTRIAQAEDLDARFAEAVEARENLRDTDKKETRLFVQTHPDVLIIPPDPPQMMIKVDQVRHVIETIYYRPAEARERVYIFTSSAFMKEAANSLLKVLEEPPEFASIFLLTENAGELLPTIRSRSMTFNLGALPSAEIEGRLAQLRPQWNARQRALVARLSEGAIGRALSFDLESYVAARQHALIMLRSALGAGDHTELFKTTESFRSGAEGREKIDNLLRTLYALLEDLMFLQSGAPATGPQYRHSGRTQEDVRSRRLRLAAASRGRSGRSRARAAPQPAAFAVARCLRDRAGARFVNNRQWKWKRLGFVSGHRFSDADRIRKVDAPLGPGPPYRHPCTVGGYPRHCTNHCHPRLAVIPYPQFTPLDPQSQARVLWHILPAQRAGGAI